MTFNNYSSECMFCGGFYGSCHGQPACGTCHMFLFPANLDYELTGCDIDATSLDSGNEDLALDPSDEFSSNADIFSGETLAQRVQALSGRNPNEDLRPLQENLVSNLPVPILLRIFRCLDDVGVYMCSNVCLRWRDVITESLNVNWQAAVEKRWSFFVHHFEVKCWRTIYGHLMESAACHRCIMDVAYVGRRNASQEYYLRSHRLQSEIRSLKTDPPIGIDVVGLDNIGYLFQAIIEGPIDSPYEGGQFYTYIWVPENYPIRPPLVRFSTKIFHPNISRHGDVGIDSIYNNNWSPTLTLSKVLVGIQSLMTDPNCDVCMEPSRAQLYLSDRNKFNRIAQSYTWKFAMWDFIKPKYRGYD